MNYRIDSISVSHPIINPFLTSAPFGVVYVIRTSVPVSIPSQSNHVPSVQMHAVTCVKEIDLEYTY